jgi:hypothetical protein
MASPQSSQDSIPPSLSHLRRQLAGGGADSAEPARRSASADETVDFDSMTGDDPVREELGQAVPPKPKSDDIEALLERYQAEKSRKTPTDIQLDPAAPGLPPLTRAAGSRRNGTQLSAAAEMKRNNGLPALTTNAQVELDKLRAENAELKKMLAEVQQFYAEHDPSHLEQQQQEVESALSAKDAEIAALKVQVEEWHSKMQTHRLVPSEDEMAKMSDELEKERCQLAQERKQIETGRTELGDDEETLMKQMREMEVGLAKDRAELARQRTELQRLHVEIKHELEQLDRGDASMKERLAQFQRRHTEVFSRPSQAHSPMASAPTPPPAADSASTAPKPRDSVLRRFFRQDK